MWAWFLMAAQAMAPTAEPWEVLQSEQVVIRCHDEPAQRFTCEAVTRIEVTPDSVWAVVSDPTGYPEVFPRVQAATVTDDGAIDVQFDLPWPLPPWPLKVTSTTDTAHRRIALQDVGPGPGVWDRAEVEVLAREGGSELHWTWHGEHHHPGWIHRRIQKTYGHDSLWAVALAVGGEARSP